MLAAEKGRSKRRRTKKTSKSTNRRRSSPRRGPQLTSLFTKLLAIGTLVVCGAVSWFLIGSDAFTVHQLNVVGSQRIGSSKMTTIADVTGRSIFTINTDELRQKIIQSSPYVKNATIDYRLPGQIVVKIEERAASFAWKSGTMLYDVADDGTVLGPSEGIATGPTIIDIDNRPIVPGTRVDSHVLAMAQQLRDELPTKVGIQGREFRRSEAEGISVTTANGLQIIFGTDDDWQSKLSVLQTVISESKGRNLQYIDLRLKNRPYFK